MTEDSARVRVRGCRESAVCGQPSRGLRHRTRGFWRLRRSHGWPTAICAWRRVPTPPPPASASLQEDSEDPLTADEIAGVIHEVLDEREGA